MHMLMILSLSPFSFKVKLIAYLGLVPAIGLQKGWRDFHWLVTVPPIIITLLFKLYCTKRFDRAFRYYIPTEEEINHAKVHSEGADAKGHRLERRFGHPALHVELFTPMLHANMMALLGSVYQGKVSDASAKLEEYGGEKHDAQVVPGGIMIAAVNQVGQSWASPCFDFIHLLTLLNSLERIGVRPSAVSA
jgi:hypothetical protein